MRTSFLALVPLAAALARAASAHDTWVQTNTPVVRTGDAIYICPCCGE